MSYRHIAPTELGELASGLAGRLEGPGLASDGLRRRFWGSWVDYPNMGRVCGYRSLLRAGRQRQEAVENGAKPRVGPAAGEAVLDRFLTPLS